MILDDFVMLGTAVPEVTATGMITVCSAGYSQELGELIRVYPLDMRAGFRRWENYQLPLRRNPKDSRRESWRLAGSPQLEASARGVVCKSDRLAHVDRFLVPSVAYLNAQRASLGIIRPPSMSLYLGDNDERLPLLESVSLPGFERPTTPTRDRFYRVPRVKFDDDDGAHDTSLLEWGAFEFLRKHPTGDLHAAFRLGDPAREVRLLVGNLARHRNAFIVIAILGFSVAGTERAQMPLFDAASSS